MKVNLTKEEIEIIEEALNYYEEDYYMVRDDKWQKTINNLITKIQIIDLELKQKQK